MTDTLVTNITVLDRDTGFIKHQVPFNSALRGGDDSAVHRSSLFVLTLVAAGVDIIVVDLEDSNSDGKPVIMQGLKIGDGPYTTQSLGMAVYPL